MTDDTTFIKREINNTVSDIFTLMKEYRLEPPPKTVPTIANTIYYPYPPGLMKAESFTVNTNTIIPELRIVQSQQEWNRLQQLAITSGFPTHVFPRRDDFGIYPTPADIYTVTIVGTYQPVRMTVDDYTTGHVSATNGDATITTSDGTFTEAMVDRWFTLTDSSSLIPSGKWYRIASFTYAQHMELSRTFTETSVEGATYVIGQSPELPEELHQFIPYKVGATYWHSRRHDSVRAQELLNYHMTGDYNNTKRGGSRMTGGVLATLNDLQNKNRGSSNLIETFDRGRENNYMTNVLWGTVLTDSS